MKSFRPRRLVVRFVVYSITFAVFMLVIMGIIGQLNSRRDILTWLLSGVLYGIGMTIFEIRLYKVKRLPKARLNDISSKIKTWGFQPKPYGKADVLYFERSAAVRGFMRSEEFYLYEDGDEIIVEGLKKYLKLLT